MIALGNRRIFLCGTPVDMRKGIDGLAAIVLGQLQRDPNSGEVFVFVGSHGSRLKALCWDRDGYWLATKRLARGRFVVPRVAHVDGRPSSLELSASDWQLLLDGIVVRSRTVLERWRLIRQHSPIQGFRCISRILPQDASVIGHGAVGYPPAPRESLVAGTMSNNTVKP